MKTGVLFFFKRKVLIGRQQQQEVMSPSDAQSEHGHQAVERAVFPAQHAASCRGRHQTNQSAGWTCDVINDVTTRGRRGRTVARAVPEAGAAHLDAGAVLLRDGTAHWRQVSNTS